MKNLLILTLIFINLLDSIAQDTAVVTKRLNFTQGFNHIINKDEFRSPYVYKGLNTLIGFGTERITIKTRHSISSSFSFGTIRTKFSPLASNSILNIQYSFLKPLIKNKSLTVWLGPGIGALAWRADYFPEMEAPVYSKVHSYYLGFSAGLSSIIDYHFNSRNKISLYLNTPLLNYVERPQFLNKDKSDKIGLFNLWNPQIGLSYEAKIHSKISILVKYQYSYLHYKNPKPVRMLTNGLSIGFKINLYEGPKKKLKF